MEPAILWLPRADHSPKLFVRSLQVAVTFSGSVQEELLRAASVSTRSKIPCPLSEVTGHSTVGFTGLAANARRPEQVLND